jgi:rod shape-determining protein MreB
VSSKALKKDVLYGDEALANRLSLDLYRPLAAAVIQHSDGRQRRGASRREGGAGPVRHAVSLAKPRADELIYAVIGLPAQCSIKNKQALSTRRGRSSTR